MNSLFGAFKLTKNADTNKYSYSRHGIGFDRCRSFSLSDGCGLVKSVIISGIENNSFENNYSCRLKTS